MKWLNIERFDDDLEHVTKFVFTKTDAVVETVLYRYPTYEKRTVICHSVMSGCPIGCRFCGTGDYFIRNLTVEEMIEQVQYAVEQTNIDPLEIESFQIMSMSMGEPLLNRNLKKAYKIMHKTWPNAALLLSTSAPDVDYEWVLDMAEQISKVGLQFSVHESTDEARGKLIPFQKKLTLKGMAKIGKQFLVRTERRPFFNYCAHEKNSSEEDARRLASLFPPEFWNATVSVICEQNDGMPTTNDFQRSLATDFSNKLLNFGFNVRVFDPAGQDTIGGGCGQLHYVQKWAKENPQKVRKSIGYGKSKIHTPRLIKGA